MWFSMVYADPAHAEVPFKHPPSTLYSLLSRARAQTFGRSQEEPRWGRAQLLAAFKVEGVLASGQEDFWVAGKMSIGYGGLEPLWERGNRPRLKMLEEIRQKSLDELEELMAGQSVESAANGAAADDEPEDDDVVDHQAQGREAV